MTEEDIRESQEMVENTVQQIKVLRDAIAELEKLVVKHQQFILDHITGKK